MTLNQKKDNSIHYNPQCIYINAIIFLYRCFFDVFFFARLPDKQPWFTMQTIINAASSTLLLDIIIVLIQIQKQQDLLEFDK